MRNQIASAMANKGGGGWGQWAQGRKSTALAGMSGQQRTDWLAKHPKAQASWNRFQGMGQMQPMRGPMGMQQVSKDIMKKLPFTREFVSQMPSLIRDQAFMNYGASNPDWNDPRSIMQAAGRLHLEQPLSSYYRPQGMGPRAQGGGMGQQQQGGNPAAAAYWANWTPGQLGSVPFVPRPRPNYWNDPFGGGA